MYTEGIIIIVLNIIIACFNVEVASLLTIIVRLFLAFKFKDIYLNKVEKKVNERYRVFKNKLPEMTEDEMLKLLATDGMLVKRPLLIGDDFVLVGFREIEWNEKFNK